MSNSTLAEGELPVSSRSIADPDVDAERTRLKRKWNVYSPEELKARIPSSTAAVP